MKKLIKDYIDLKYGEKNNVIKWIRIMMDITIYICAWVLTIFSLFLIGGL